MVDPLDFGIRGVRFGRAGQVKTTLSSEALRTVGATVGSAFGGAVGGLFGVAVGITAGQCANVWAVAR